MASLLIDTHRWRGISAARDMFFSAVLVLGFVTIGIYRGSIFEKLRELARSMKSISNPHARGLHHD